MRILSWVHFDFAVVLFGLVASIGFLCLESYKISAAASSEYLDALPDALPDAFVDAVETFPDVNEAANAVEEKSPEYDVIMFTTVGCGPCEQMKKLLQSLRMKASITYVDPSQPIPDGVSVKYWPRAYPYTVLYRKGKLIGQWSGYAPQIKEAINDGNQ